MTTLAFLSGAHIALGAMLAVSTGGSVPALKAQNPGAARALMGSLGLPMGLLMVLGGGGELVTGNMAVCSAAWQAKKASFKQLITNLGVVYAGNLVGSLAVAFIANMAATGIAPGAIAVASGKVAQTFGAAFAKGILCNWLAHKDLASKAAAVFFPISGFIACGFEHSVANMFLLPFGILQGADITVGQAVVKNLIPVTLGNLVGGAIFVGAFYHNAYGK
ncbi:Formate/nitrite transporter [Aureococcus anophagefferens]|nr:Formate/nitrite transporter [Aureococcus anophagefferens]